MDVTVFAKMLIDLILFKRVEVVKVMLNLNIVISNLSRQFLTKPRIHLLFFKMAEQPQKPTRIVAQPRVMNDQASSWNNDIRVFDSNTKSCDKLYL